LLIFSLALNLKIVSSADTSVIYVDPPSVVGLNPSQTFTIEVKLDNVTELFGFDIQFSWDPAVLDYVDHTAKVPVTTFPDGLLYETVLWLKDDVDAVAGTYWLAATSLAPAPSFNGSATFFNMTFHVKSVGRCMLEIFSSDLADKGGGAIAHTVENGLFTNFEHTPADIYVDPDKVIDAALTPCHNFSVDVKLDGVVDLETLEFWLGYNTTVLDLVNASVNGVLQPSVTVDISELAGQMRLQASLSSSLSGDFTLATLIFHVSDVGESDLDLFNVTLIDDWNETMPYHEPGDGFFSNILKARIFVDPPEIIDPLLLPGSEFSIDIKIESAIDLYGYYFCLSYDTNILTCLGAIINPPNNDTHFLTEIDLVDIDGYICVNVTYYAPAEPITILPPTTVVTIFFQVQNFGCTPLDLHDTILKDQHGGLITHDAEDGFFCTLIADVAILDVYASTNMTYIDSECHRTINVTVVAGNVGDTTETFNVTAYFDNITIGIETVLDLPPGENLTIIFVWDPTGLPACTNYTLSAEATSVPYELNLTNNVYVNGWVKTKILGDVNGDGAVDIFDIVLTSDAYGSDEGDPAYNIEADVAPACGRVDIFDVVTVCSRYGLSCSVP
jgi:hypothetical protein